MLPGKYPTEASEAHGKAVLPYLATLLFLSAREGGAAQAVEYIKRQSRQGASNYFEALVCYLDNGLAFSRIDPICINQGVVKDTNRIIDFFKSHKISFSLC